MAIILAIIPFITGSYVELDPNTRTEKNQCTVTFVNYDNTGISSQKVNLGESVVVPNNPSKSGTSFLGWSGNYINVTKDETVKAVFSDEKNVFVISQTSGKKGSTVKVKVSLNGLVKTCGFDMTIKYDSNLQLISYDDELDLDIVVNSKAINNGVLLNYSSASNISKKKEIIELIFKIKDNTKTELPVTIDMKSVKEVAGNNVINGSYTVIGGIVFVTN